MQIFTLVMTEYCINDIGDDDVVIDNDHNVTKITSSVTRHLSSAYSVSIRGFPRLS